MKRLITLVAASLLLVGCAKYYKVTDPSTGRIYYSQDVKTLPSGATEFTDGHYGGKVVLQNSEVHQISKQQFETDRVAQAATKSTK